MASSNPKALAKRNASVALMAPPPAPKRIKRPSVVLNEDTYTSAISHIIRRDFFPGLAETDAQREYLSALESKDKTWLREAGKRLSEVMSPAPNRRARATRFENNSVDGGKTPRVWAANTPKSNAKSDEDASEDEEMGKLDKADLDMGLGAFQAKYTSEDQESFNQIIDRANAKRFEKSAWLREGNRYASKQRIAQQKVLDSRKPSDSTELIARPSQDLDVDRPAAPNYHKHTAFNSLMFEPDSVESWAPTRAGRAEAASLAPPKKVLHHNTRLPIVGDVESSRPPSPTMSAVREAIAGHPRLTSSEGGYTGSETPRVNGYAFVDALPPEPTEDEEEEVPTDLLERFGTKGSTASPFTIKEANTREKLHHKMVDKINASRRGGSDSRSRSGAELGIGTVRGEAKTPRFLSVPTPAVLAQASRTPGRKLGGLTPAAQRLFERVGSTPKGQIQGGFVGGGHGKQWATPAPNVRRKA